MQQVFKGPQSCVCFVFSLPWKKILRYWYRHTPTTKYWPWFSPLCSCVWTVYSRRLPSKGPMGIWSVCLIKQLRCTTRWRNRRWRSCLPHGKGQSGFLRPQPWNDITKSALNMNWDGPLWDPYCFLNGFLSRSKDIKQLLVSFMYLQSLLQPKNRLGRSQFTI
jgi:hypothetical protein